MKILDVPLHLQAKDSEDCGPISSLMILDYFGITSDSAEVIKRVPRCNFGTSTFGNALALMDYGLEVEMVTVHPKIFDGDFLQRKSNKETRLARVKEVIKNEADSDKQGILRSLVRYIQEDGILTLEIPTKEIIKDALDAGKVVLVSMYARALGEKEGGYHFVVIAGYRDDEFLILNPWPLSRQKSWENADSVIFAIHVSTLFDYDNGAILLVKK